MTRDGDPHAIESELEEMDEYQAPPHDEELGEGSRSDGDDDAEVDLELLEAGRQRPGLQTSETVEVEEERRATSITVSGKDELADPADPRAVPPGESM